jgi:hypothetical protein
VISSINSELKIYSKWVDYWLNNFFGSLLPTSMTPNTWSENSTFCSVLCSKLALSKCFSLHLRIKRMTHDCQSRSRPNRQSQSYFVHRTVTARRFRRSTRHSLTNFTRDRISPRDVQNEPSSLIWDLRLDKGTLDIIRLRYLSRESIYSN